LTKAHIQDRRKNETIVNLTAKYGNVTVGIHGQELPKYSGEMSTREWWRHKANFN
jgi:hypothetical protein